MILKATKQTDEAVEKALRKYKFLEKKLKDGEDIGSDVLLKILEGVIKSLKKDGDQK